MASDEEKRNRIMDYAFKRFTAAGITQVTMDELARGVGMGKGTLYKYFPSKEALLSDTVDYFASNLEKEVEKALSDATLTPALKLSLFLKTVAGKLSQLNPAALSDIDRNIPEVFEKINRTRERIIMNNLVRVLSDGKKTGLLKKEVDEILTAHIFLGAISRIADVKVLPTLDYSIDRLFTAIISTIFTGCLTEEGRKLTYPDRMQEELSIREKKLSSPNIV
jgi:AcrR family transcriptional regulator